MAMPAIRAAKISDVRAIHGLLLQFGAHWGHKDWVSATPETLQAALFGTEPNGFGHVAEIDGQVIGVALWFLTFNFWMAEPILFLEDIYVDEAARGNGAGAALMRTLAQEATRRGCARIDWIVKADDRDSQRFYARHGGERQGEFEVWRMECDALARLVTPT